MKEIQPIRGTSKRCVDEDDAKLLGIMAKRRQFWNSPHRGYFPLRQNVVLYFAYLR